MPVGLAGGAPRGREVDRLGGPVPAHLTLSALQGPAPEAYPSLVRAGLRATRYHRYDLVPSTMHEGMPQGGWDALPESTRADDPALAAVWAHAEDLGAAGHESRRLYPPAVLDLVTGTWVPLGPDGGTVSPVPSTLWSRLDAMRPALRVQMLHAVLAHEVLAWSGEARRRALGRMPARLLEPTTLAALLAEGTRAQRVQVAGLLAELGPARAGVPRPGMPAAHGPAPARGGR